MQTCERLTEANARWRPMKVINVKVTYTPKDPLTKEKIEALIGAHGQGAKLSIGGPGHTVTMRLSTLLNVLTEGKHNKCFPVPRMDRCGVRQHVW